MKSIDTISVPTMWDKDAPTHINDILCEQKKKQELLIGNVLAQGGVLFNTHTTVMSGVMYVTYILTK